MTNGFDEARAQRNWLQRLGEKIPGFRGFQDRELRREVDKMQREHIASEIITLKGVVRDRARAYTDAGKLGSLDLLDRLDRRLDGLAQSVRFSDYGATGFFDVVKIGESELQKLYEFDLSVLDDVAQLGEALSAIPEPGEAEPAAAADLGLDRIAQLKDKWNGRENVLSEVVRSVG